MSGPSLEELKAADEFRNTLVLKADAYNGAAPLWHGWAIMQAFLMGAAFARDQHKQHNPNRGAVCPHGVRGIAACHVCTPREAPEAFAANSI